LVIIIRRRWARPRQYVVHTLHADRSESRFGKAILPRLGWCSRLSPDARARNRRVTTLP